jgi:hypothetical protein
MNFDLSVADIDELEVALVYHLQHHHRHIVILNHEGYEEECSRRRVLLGRLRDARVAYTSARAWLKDWPPDTKVRHRRTGRDGIVVEQLPDLEPPLITIRWGDGSTASAVGYDQGEVAEKISARVD